MRIHTGEKPFVCGVCSRGYRDKRELKKHQATHNHGEPDPDLSGPEDEPLPPGAPDPGRVTVVAAAPPQTSPRPAAPAAAVQAAKPVQVVQTAAQSAAQQQQQQLATITFSLPTEPVPKNQLGLPQPEPQQFIQPLNPAQITLPPSVATALQNLNQKTAKPAAATTMVAVAAPAQAAVKQEQQVVKQVQLVEPGGDGGQISFATAGGLPPGLVTTGGSHPQFFYYLMPGTAVQGEGGGAAQLVTLPPGTGLVQAAQLPAASSAATFPQLAAGQYIIETPAAAPGTPARPGQI